MKMVILLNFILTFGVILISLSFLVLTLRNLVLYSKHYLRQNFYPYATVYLLFFTTSFLYLEEKINKIYPILKKKELIFMYFPILLLLVLLPFSKDVASTKISLCIVYIVISTILVVSLRKIHWYILLAFPLFFSNDLMDFLFVSYISIILVVIERYIISERLKRYLQIVTILISMLNIDILRILFLIPLLYYISTKKERLIESKLREFYATMSFILTLTAVFPLLHIDEELYLGPFYGVALSTAVSFFFFINLDTILRAGYLKENPEKYYNMNKILLIISTFLPISKSLLLPLYYFFAALLGLFGIYYTIRTSQLLLRSL